MTVKGDLPQANDVYRRYYHEQKKHNKNNDQKTKLTSIESAKAIYIISRN